MNKKCTRCRGSGVIAKEGKFVGNHKPYDLVCPACNGVGHHRD